MFPNHKSKHQCKFSMMEEGNKEPQDEGHLLEETLRLRGLGINQTLLIFFTRCKRWMFGLQQCLCDWIYYEAKWIFLKILFTCLRETSGVFMNSNKPLQISFLFFTGRLIKARAVTQMIPSDWYFKLRTNRTSWDSLRKPSFQKQVQTPCE